MSMFKDLLNNIKSKIAESRKEADEIVKETGAIITSDPNDPSNVNVYMPTAQEKRIIENITEHKTDDSKYPYIRRSSKRAYVPERVETSLC